MAEAAGEKTGRGADEREELEGGVVMAHIIIRGHNLIYLRFVYVSKTS